MSFNYNEKLFTKNNEIEILAWSKYRRLIWRKRHHNIVVTAGRSVVRDMLAEGRVNPITHYAWGDGGHLPADPSQNIPAVMSDIALSNEILRKTVSSRQYPAADALRLIGIIDPQEIVGQAVSEQALFLQDGTMFAKVTYPKIYKGLVQLEFRWTIYC